MAEDNPTRKNKSDGPPPGPEREKKRVALTCVPFSPEQAAAKQAAALEADKARKATLSDARALLRANREEQQQKAQKAEEKAQKAQQREKKQAEKEARKEELPVSRRDFAERLRVIALKIENAEPHLLLTIFSQLTTATQATWSQLKEVAKEEAALKRAEVCPHGASQQAEITPKAMWSLLVEEIAPDHLASGGIGPNGSAFNLPSLKHLLRLLRLVFYVPDERVHCPACSDVMESPQYHRQVEDNFAVRLLNYFKHTGTVAYNAILEEVDPKHAESYCQKTQKQTRDALEKVLWFAAMVHLKDKETNLSSETDLIEYLRSLSDETITEHWKAFNDAYVTQQVEAKEREKKEAKQKKDAMRQAKAQAKKAQSEAAKKQKLAEREEKALEKAQERQAAKEEKVQQKEQQKQAQIKEDVQAVMCVIKPHDDEFIAPEHVPRLDLKQLRAFFLHHVENPTASKWTIDKCMGEMRQYVQDEAEYARACHKMKYSVPRDEEPTGGHIKRFQKLGVSWEIAERFLVEEKHTSAETVKVAKTIFEKAALLQLHKRTLAPGLAKTLAQWKMKWREQRAA